MYGIYIFSLCILVCLFWGSFGVFLKYIGGVDVASCIENEGRMLLRSGFVSRNEHGCCERVLYL